MQFPHGQGLGPLPGQRRRQRSGSPIAEGSDVLLTEPEVAPKPSDQLEYVSFKEAVKLAQMKPDKGFTRNDLLVYAGWLTKKWEWSRDLNVPLQDAITNGLRLGDKVKVVAGRGKPIPVAPGPIRGNGDAPKIPEPSPSPHPARRVNKWSLFAPKRKRNEGKN